MMELWPFTNFHDLNLDWIIKTIKVYTKKVDDLYDFGLYDFVEKVLAAHPEWTTTVMDKAISRQKLADSTLQTFIMTYDTVADMIADEDLPENARVRTKGYWSADDGMGLTYDIKASGYSEKCYEVLDNGLYAIADFGLTELNDKGNGPVDELLETALSYQSAPVTWTYSNTGTDTYPTAVDAGYVPGTHYIDCSSLLILILNGIKYENSAYNNVINLRSQGMPYLPDFHTNHYTKLRATYNIAQYLCMKGDAYIPNADKSNLRVGDIVFFAHGLHDYPERFMDIDHCAIYMGECGVNSAGVKRYQFIGNDGGEGTDVHTFFYIGSQNYLDNVVLAAGINKEPVETNANAENIAAFASETVTGSTETAFQYLLRKPLKSFTAYTVTVKISNPSSYRVTFSIPNHTLYSDAYSVQAMYSDEETLTWHIITGDLDAESITNKSIFRLTVHEFTGNNVSTAVIDNLAITEGWDTKAYNEPAGRITATLTYSDIASGSLSIYENMVYTNITFTGAQSGNHSLGNLGSIYPDQFKTPLNYYPVFLDGINKMGFIRVYNGAVAVITPESGYTGLRTVR